MHSQYVTVTPEALMPLVDCLCGEHQDLKQQVSSDIQTFLSPRIHCGYLSSAFTTSALGYNGCPVEFSLSSAAPNALASTYDTVLPYSPSLSPDLLAEHYDQYTCLASKQNAASSPCFSMTETLQPSQWEKLKFGTWFGRKYSSKGVATKLYSEACDKSYPADSETLLKSLEACGLKLLMVGYYPEKVQSPQEFYLQWNSATLTFSDIKEITGVFETMHLRSLFLAFISQVLNIVAPDGKLPNNTYGISFTRTYSGEIKNLTLFTMAPRFLNADSTKLEQLLSLTNQLGFSIPALNALHTNNIAIQFNVLGFTVDDTGKASLNCTLSPCVKAFTITQRSLPISHGTNCSNSDKLASIIAKNQTSNGAFLSHVKVPGGRRYQDENGFVTAQVLRTLVDKPKDWPPIERALDFLQSCEIEPGRYSFWPQANHPSWMRAERIQPDIDDTVVIAELLFRFGRLSQQDYQQVLYAINGYQVTSVDPRRSEAQHQWASCQSFYTWMTPSEDITQLDCCVNTNALIFLHQYQKITQTPLPAYRQILKMLHRAIEWSDNQYPKLASLTPYYAHPNEWLSALSYAQSVGVPGLEPLLKFLSPWRFPSELAPLPLYQRHDGRYLWTATYLGQLRTLARYRNLKETNYESFTF